MTRWIIEARAASSEKLPDRFVVLIEVYHLCMGLSLPLSKHLE